MAEGGKYVEIPRRGGLVLASGIGIAVAKISAEILKWRPFDIDIASFFATYLYQVMNRTSLRGMSWVARMEPKKNQIVRTEPGIKVSSWLRDISCCSCLTVLPGIALVLLSKICKHLFPPL